MEIKEAIINVLGLRNHWRWIFSAIESALKRRYLRVAWLTRWKQVGENYDGEFWSIRGEDCPTMVFGDGYFDFFEYKTQGVDKILRPVYRSSNWDVRLEGLPKNKILVE